MKRFLVKCKKELVLFIIAHIICEGIYALRAIMLEYVSNVALGEAAGSMVLSCALIALYAAADTGMYYPCRISWRRLKLKLSMLLRNSVTERVLSLSVEEKEQKGDAYYISLLTNSVNEVETKYTQLIMEVFAGALDLVFGLAVITHIDPIIAVIVVVLGAAPVAVPNLLSKKLEGSSRESVSAKADCANAINEILEGFMPIKLFGRSGTLYRRYEKRNRESFEKEMTSMRWQHFSGAISNGIFCIINNAAWIVGLIFLMMGRIGYAQLIALTSIVASVSDAFYIFSDSYASIISGGATLKDLLKFIDAKDADSSRYRCEDENISSIELKNAVVERDGRRILDDVSVKINDGEKLCLIGSSGSGKTSILKAIAGVLTLTDGELLVNGRETENKRGVTCRDLLMFPQETALFSATIGENVTMFGSDESNAAESLERAGLSDWFEKTGGRLDKKIEKSSANLSGGEKRRMDFARSLCEGGRILLFDEPTAGLDAKNADTIWGEIAAMDGMIITATHDIDEDNLRRFDRVFVIEDGRLCLAGVPEIIIASEMYKRLRAAVK